MNFIKGFTSALFTKTEEIPYEVTRKLDSYEERHYPAGKYVCTKINGNGRDPHNRALFMSLFNYISGTNDQQMKINMTAPVVTRVDPSSDGDNKYTMCFYIPKNLQETDLPKPTNPEVFLDDLPEMTVLTRTFGGYAHDAQYKEEKTALEELVKNETGVVTSYFFEVGYDPPFKPFGRRNELWLVKTSQSEPITE